MTIEEYQTRYKELMSQIDGIKDSMLVECQVNDTFQTYPSALIYNIQTKEVLAYIHSSVYPRLFETDFPHYNDIGKRKFLEFEAARDYLLPLVNIKAKNSTITVLKYALENLRFIYHKSNRVEPEEKIPKRLSWYRKFKVWWNYSIKNS